MDLNYTEEELAFRDEVREWITSAMPEGMATRAASICRDVSHAGSVAFRAYSPRLIVLPATATPFMRPL